MKYYITDKYGKFYDIEFDTEQDAINYANLNSIQYVIVSEEDLKEQ